MEVAAGGKTSGEFVIKINRQEGFTGAVKFANAMDEKKIRGIKNALPPVLVSGAALKDENQAAIKVTPQPRAIAGEVYDVVVSGTLRIGKEDIVRSIIVPVKISEKKIEKTEKSK